MAKKRKKPAVVAVTGSIFDVKEVETLSRETSYATVAAELKRCTKCACFMRNGVNSPKCGSGRIDRPLIAFVLESPSDIDMRAGEILPVQTSAAGRVFNAMLECMNLSREDVFLCYAVSCHFGPTVPLGEIEIAACHSHLTAQLEAVKPYVIVACGWVAHAALIGHSRDSDLQYDAWDLAFGEWQFAKGGVGQYRVMHHPAQLANVPELHNKTWRELQAVMQRLSCLTPDYKPPAVIQENLEDRLARWNTPV